MAHTSLKQKLILITFGVFVSLILIELILRLGGHLYSLSQEMKDSKISFLANEYRILCLGESTTAFGGEFSYPKVLEKILNEQVKGKKFAVINKGVPATNTSNILSRLDYRLRQYKPHMVITMMGINDAEHTDLLAVSLMGRIKHFVRDLSTYKLLEFFYFFSMRKAKGEDVFLKTGQYFKEGRYYLAAEEMFKKSIAASASNSQAYFSLGWFYHELGRYRKAEEVFQEAVEHAPSDPMVYTELGRHYNDRGLFQQGEAAIKRAIELASDKQLLYAELGANYQGQGKLIQAEEVLKKSIKDYPEDPEARLALARFYQSTGRYQEAETVFKQSLALSWHEETIIELGWCYASQRIFGQAEEMFALVIAKNPKSETGYLEFGKYSLERKDFLTAEKMLKKAVKINKNNRGAYEWLAEAYERMGKEKEAARYLSKGAVIKENLDSITRRNYRKLKEKVLSRGIALVCVQYPMRDVNDLKEMFDSTGSMVFVDNQESFKDRVRRSSFSEYFKDDFGGDFGHCTSKGNQLLAKNIAQSIIKEFFKDEAAY